MDENEFRRQIEETQRQIEEDSANQPDMPDDFWPEVFLISVKNIGLELSCPISYVERDKIAMVIHGLRLAMWQASYHVDPDGTPLADTLK